MTTCHIVAYENTKQLIWLDDSLALVLSCFSAKKCSTRIEAAGMIDGPGIPYFDTEMSPAAISYDPYMKAFAVAASDGTLKVMYFPQFMGPRTQPADTFKIEPTYNLKLDSPIVHVEWMPSLFFRYQE